MPSSRLQRRLDRRRAESSNQDRSNRLLFIGLIAAFAIAIVALLVKRHLDSGPVDLNHASSAKLESLPGIGPETAKLIIQGRPYETVDDLEKVKGIGPATMAKLRSRITVSE